VLTATLLLLAACAGRRSAGTLGAEPAVLASLPPQPLDRVLLLGQAGASPSDTAVAFAAWRGRTVVIRHPPPDNAIFAMITVPADSTATDSVALTLTPMPGRYGLRLLATPRLPAGTVLTFSYAIHFHAPEGAEASYGSVSRYARSMGIGQLLDDGRFRFLPERRPATDMLAIELPGSGEYAVAAPR
jgi:hypothetical protein